MKQNYSKFTVAAHESALDTSTQSHPGLLKQEYNTPVCNEKSYRIHISLVNY